ncbi:hypothetical protein G6F59_018413 [Rhizopus arrhizus]|nr:hypothetical protein G6F59_018413 [Rhizopus arrhizus]
MQLLFPILQRRVSQTRGHAMPAGGLPAHGRGVTIKAWKSAPPFQTDHRHAIAALPRPAAQPGPVQAAVRCAVDRRAARRRALSA